MPTLYALINILFLKFEACVTISSYAQFIAKNDAYACASLTWIFGDDWNNKLLSRQIDVFTTLL